MDKVFLVDDEEWIVENLKISVDWGKYGFEIAGSADNGLDAYRKIMEIKPQLVFTDIRMAGMNGLELIKRVSEHLGHVTFIVISGFAEFAYAQKALNNGAFSYLLKPIDENEIIQLLVKLNGKKKEHETEDNFYETLLLSGENSSTRKSLVNNRFMAAGLDLDRGIWVIVSAGRERLSLPGVSHKIVFQTGVDRTAYFIQETSGILSSQILPEPLPDWVWGIGISNVFSRGDLILDRIDEAAIAAFHYFIDPLSKVNYYSNISGSSMAAEEFFMAVQKQLKDGNLSELEAILGKAPAHFEKGGMNVLHAFHLYNLLYFYLQGKMEYSPLSHITGFERLVLRYGDVKRLLEGLKEAMQKAKIHGAGGIHTYNLKNETAGAIIKYLNSNFANDISLTEVSDKLNINPGYASQLLKKEIGKNYLEYLTTLRIENACKLLKTTDLNVNQIAEKSGYDDFLYFRKIFKKSTGHTPSEYREAFKNKREEQQSP